MWFYNKQTIKWGKKLNEEFEIRNKRIWSKEETVYSDIVEEENRNNALVKADDKMIF